MRLNADTTIKGSKVVLVPYRREHVPSYHEWMQSPELQASGRGPRARGRRRSSSLPPAHRAFAPAAHAISRRRGPHIPTLRCVPSPCQKVLVGLLCPHTWLCYHPPPPSTAHHPSPRRS